MCKGLGGGLVCEVIACLCAVSLSVCLSVCGCGMCMHVEYVCGVGCTRVMCVGAWGGEPV